MTRITLIGVPPAGLDALAPFERKLIGAAAVLAAAARHLHALGPLAAEAAVIEITGDLDAALDHIARAASAGQVVVLASGDPGFFGLGRALAERFGPEALEVRPAASSVAVAFGRLGIPWDDAVVASAHGRPLSAAVAAIRGTRKAAVLAGPDATPQALGRALLDGGVCFDRAAVVSDVGTGSESVGTGDLAWLAAGDFSPLSVVVLLHGDPVSPSATVSWPPGVGRAARGFGRAEDDFDHRGGMITKSEVRAVVLARLELPASGVLWDVGAGSGSVGIEAAVLEPGLEVIAIERDLESCERIAANAARLGVPVRVVAAEAPQCLGPLPSPDRVVLGGGGIAVLDRALARLRPDGRVVAMYASLERAVAASQLLGNLVQVGVSRAKALPDGSVRLAALDPVFLCWGPQ